MNPLERCKQNHPSQRGRNERVFNDIVNDYYTNRRVEERRIYPTNDTPPTKRTWRY